jgi:glutaredoxin 3
MLNVLFASFLLLSSPSPAAVPRVERSESPAPCAAKEKPVLNLFYMSSCPHSVQVLNYLTQIQKQVPLTNVKNNPQAKEYLRTHGGEMQVPCLFINGKPLYHSDEIIQWLSQHQDMLDPA